MNALEHIALNTSIVLNMGESESTPPLGDDVNFRGCGDCALDSTVTFNPFSLHELVYLPSQLTEGDSRKHNDITSCLKEVMISVMEVIIV